MAFNWDIRRIYLYLVSFATLMMMIIGSVQTVQAVLNFIYPEPLPPIYSSPVYPDKSGVDKSTLTKEQLNRQIEEEQQRQKAYQKYSRIRDLVNSLAMVGVSLPVYLYHWRKVQDTEKQ